MGVFARYAILCAAPAVAFAGLARAVRWIQEADRMPWEQAPRPQPSGRPIENLAADLRRLSDERRAVRVTAQPAAHHRRQAVDLAYDDVLADCSRALGLPHPGKPPLSEQSRADAEARLHEAGLRW